LLRARREGETLALAAGSDRNAAALRASGLRVQQGDRALEAAAPEGRLLGARLPALDAPYDLLLLCTRTDSLEQALAPAVPLLALNCAMSTIGTVAGLTLGELAARRQARALGLMVLAEVVEVARAHGVRLERVSGLDPSWLADGRGLRAALLRPLRHALLWAA